MPRRIHLNEHAHTNFFNVLAALSDGGSEEIFEPLTLEIGTDDQPSHRNDLHTP